MTTEEIDRISVAEYYEAVVKWRRLPYNSIDDMDSIRAELDAATINRPEMVKAKGFDKLPRAIAQLLTIYQSQTPGTLFREYVAAREPAKYRLIEADAREIAAAAALPSDGPILDVIAATYNHFAPTPQLAGICGKASDILIFSAKKSFVDYYPAADTKPHARLSLPGNSGFLTLYKQFEFEEDFDSLYNSGEHVLLAQARLHAKVRSSGDVGRIILRFVWCPKADEWRPHEYASDVNMRGLHVLLP